GSVNELLETSLSEEIEKRIMDIIVNTPGVKSSHNMKTRRIGNTIAVDIHINVDSNLNIVSAHDISTTVEKRIRDVFGKNTFVSIHLEPS
ncbi:MAG: cation-efflux pump, partial [Candidatus Omnitrophica bacterium]|nr:cation-efflux pump [Candidatus Omnitrophota bacterium]